MAGHEITQFAQDAIENHVAGIQGSYDSVVAIKEKIEADQEAFNEKVESWGDDNEPLATALAWTEFPEDAAPEEVASMIIYSNIEENALNHLSCPDLFEQINSKLADWESENPEHLAAIQKIAMTELGKFRALQEGIQGLGQELQMEVMQNQAVGYLLTGMPYLDATVIKPEDDSDEWSVASMFLVADEDGKVSIAEELPFDISLSAEVVSDKPGLKDIFNVAAYGVPAGEKLEPYVVNVSKEDGQNYTVMINNHVLTSGGEFQSNSLQIPVEEQTDEPEDPTAMFQQLMM
jgi:hypothetical protein